MGTLYRQECCPECGHLLTNARTMCSFCNWYNHDSLYNPVDEATESCDFLYALPHNEHIRLEAIV